MQGNWLEFEGDIVIDKGSGDWVFVGGWCGVAGIEAGGLDIDVAVVIAEEGGVAWDMVEEGKTVGVVHGVLFLGGLVVCVVVFCGECG